MTPAPAPELRFGDLAFHQRTRVLRISRDEVLNRASAYLGGERISMAMYRYMEDRRTGIPDDTVVFNVLCVVLQLEPLTALKELGYLGQLPPPLDS